MGNGKCSDEQTRRKRGFRLSVQVRTVQCVKENSIFLRSRHTQDDRPTFIASLPYAYLNLRPGALSENAPRKFAENECMHSFRIARSEVGAFHAT